MSADSATDAWAVGDYQNPTGGPVKTLILHWDGHAWSRVASPNPGGITDHLRSVSALSPTDAWAVGAYVSGGSDDRTFILHWDGMAWSQVPSPNAGPLDNELNGVGAISATDVWAVGSRGDLTTGYPDTLALHWDGMAWSITNSPNPGTFNSLASVSGVSSNHVWAVGQDSGIGYSETLALHWNGTAWSRAQTPETHGRNNHLSGVSAVSGSEALAVGALTLRWKGGKWGKVTTASVESKSLAAVSADSPTDAWAVGTYGDHGLIVRWDGVALSLASSPRPGVASGLAAVSADSPTNAWAVGTYDNRRTGYWDTLILHWDGAEWARVKSPNG